MILATQSPADSGACGTEELDLFSPDQEQAGVAGHSAGKIEHLRGEPEAVRLQIARPAQIDFRRLAAATRRRRCCAAAR
jgi:hypothetical protein